MSLPSHFLCGTGGAAACFAGLMLSAAPVDAETSAWSILSWSKGSDASVEIGIPATPNSYYILYRGTSAAQIDSPVAVELDTLRLKDRLPPTTAAFYRAKRVSLISPDDSDGDGLDDIFERRRPRYLNPVSASDRLRPQDGAYFVNNLETFAALSSRGDTPGALGVRQLKFVIAGVDTDFPLVYFMQSENHPLHAAFVFDVLHWKQTLQEFNAETYFTDSRRKNLAGSIIAYPGQGGSNTLYALEFWPADPVRFDFIRKAISAIEGQMLWAGGSIVYHPTGVTQEELYLRERAKFEGAKIRVFTSEQLFSSLKYQPIYPGIAFGRLRLFEEGSRSTPRDILLCQNPPVGQGHVAGVISASVPAPLSHFVLLARQNRTPSAYMQTALTDAELGKLVGRLVRLEVTPDLTQVREATLAEVEAWEESVRPKETRAPARNLDERRIRGLNELAAADSKSVGSKAANLGELFRLLPAGRVPQGFAIPFAYYDEFMTFNGFYEELRTMVADPSFQNNEQLRHQMLVNFQQRLVEQSKLPVWVAAALDEVHRAFPSGTRIRCRSSSNNEDLPGFNGAGLYDSFTHRPEEGALANTVKQVWASLWNPRAFDERDFQRIDHFQSAMGVLLHPSFPDESANGVAVTRNLFDPNWPGFYVNAQIGEDLVTSPAPGSIADEFLISAIGQNGEYETQYIRYSNRAPVGERVLTDDQIAELVNALAVIHTHFQPIYGQNGNPTFAMEIEFKVTADGQLSIKQARPWIE